MISPTACAAPSCAQSKCSPPFANFRERFPAAVLTSSSASAWLRGKWGRSGTSSAQSSARGAVDLGLIFPALDVESPSGQQLFKANYDLRPHAAQLSKVASKNWWILSDLGEDVTGEPIRPNHVLQNPVRQRLLS